MRADKTVVWDRKQDLQTFTNQTIRKENYTNSLCRVVKKNFEFHVMFHISRKTFRIRKDPYLGGGGGVPPGQKSVEVFFLRIHTI